MFLNSEIIFEISTFKIRLGLCMYYVSSTKENQIRSIGSSHTLTSHVCDRSDEWCVSGRGPHRIAVTLKEKCPEYKCSHVSY